MQLPRAQEDFLEACLMLEEKGQVITTTSLSSMLKISKPAIHQTGHELIDRGLINRVDYGDITLTDEGREIASRILHRHHVLEDFLDKLGVSKENAEEDACQIEHVISEETFQAIEESLKK